jgi:hypothetical protein
MIYIDLPADLNLEDDAERNIARLADAVAPDTVAPGTVLVAGAPCAWSWAVRRRVRVLPPDQRPGRLAERLPGQAASVDRCLRRGVREELLQMVAGDEPASTDFYVSQVAAAHLVV